MAAAQKKKTTKKKINKKHKTAVLNKAVKKRKIKYGRILLALVLVGLIIYLLLSFFSFNIKNIYIKGNEFLSDQEVIELAGIENYPSTFSSLMITTKNKLEDNIMIEKANVYKKGLFEMHITVTENRPLFYNQTTKKTVLKNLKTIDKKFDEPILLNYVPDKIYKRFLEKMNLIKPDILMRISEIEYKPNNVDKNRFLLSMQDSNYVYLTLSRFENINNYIKIISKFENKKGILYLDSGEYFKVLEG